MRRSLDRYISVMTHQSFLKGYDVEDMIEPVEALQRRVFVMAMDVCLILGAYTFAFLLRFDFYLMSTWLHTLMSTVPYAAMLYVLTSYYFGVNRGLRHYASFGDIVNIAKAITLTAVVHGALVLFVTQARYPRSVLLLGPILSFLAVAGMHAVVRYAKAYWHNRSQEKGEARSAVIVGAGDLGELVYRHMRTHETVNYRIVAFIDDDKSKWGMRLHGVPVVGGVSSLAELQKRRGVDEIVIATSVRRGQVISAVADAMAGQAKRPEICIVPSLEDMLRSPTQADPRKVQPADLLNRREVRLDTARIARSIAGKVVLVTGAGGTIGGELSRQVAGYKPAKVVLLENHATALFYREAELRGKLPGVEVVGVLGDVRDQSLLDRIFKTHAPQVVFHAAAHKHVHQLETNIQEGVSNNLIGTYRLADAADRHGVEVFLLISTDKAVRPTCVMGATKRAAEVVVSDFARKSKTRFMAVRFGNVLGSSGSVLKIFQEQIEKGQPITLTHPDVTRYFMTVEEAVGLVLQSASMAQGGEIFVLKMGEPVRIIDMARNLILLSGREPGRDVDIRITGLKPGEKMAEELVEDEAGQEQSAHPEIMVLRSENKSVEGLHERVLSAELASRGTDAAALLRHLTEFVPTFTADPIHDEAADTAEGAAEGAGDAASAD